MVRKGKSESKDGKALRSDFGLFIPTHGRADSQITLNALLDAGYTGDWWLVCDNLDADLDAYISEYGDRVLVFDKAEVAERTDRLTNLMELGSVLYARNYIQEKAKEMGYEIIGVFDDDLESFSIRYESDGSLQALKINEMVDSVLEAICVFITNGKISALSLAHNGGYFGGLEGDFKQGLTRNPSGAWFVNLSDETYFKYRGIVNEDSIATRDLGRVGQIVFKWMDVMFDTVKRGTNEGGHKGMYDDMSDYVHSSYVKIASPSTMNILDNGRRRTNRKAIHSEIISERWRKE